MSKTQTRLPLVRCCSPGKPYTGGDRRVLGWTADRGAKGDVYARGNTGRGTRRYALGREEGAHKAGRGLTFEGRALPALALAEEEDLDDVADPELRRKIEEALRVNGIQPATGDSDSESEEELMDDEQMMAIDEQLAAVFRARADERKLGRGAHRFLYPDS